MNRFLSLIAIIVLAVSSQAQTNLTPEQLWKFGRVSGLGISKNEAYIIYSVSTPDVNENKSTRKTYLVARSGGESVPIPNTDSFLVDTKISPNGKYYAFVKSADIMKVTGAETYKDLPKSNVYIYNCTQLPALGYLGGRKVRSYFYRTHCKRQARQNQCTRHHVQ
jgi:hypothetical protein